MRLHLCWGNYEGPHNHDIPLREIIEPVLKARPAAVSLRAPTPVTSTNGPSREVKLPDEMHYPGVIDSTTTSSSTRNSSPSVLYAMLSSSGARMSSQAWTAASPPSLGAYCGATIAWAKLGALAEGARVASQKLWHAPHEWRSTADAPRALQPVMHWLHCSEGIGLLAPLMWACPQFLAGDAGPLEGPSFAQAIVGTTVAPSEGAKPQSTPGTTFSRPTSSA